jgi:ferredoxin-NADP reductase
MNHITDSHQQFYICGPDSFVQDISGLLLHIGAKSQAVVLEA